MFRTRFILVGTAMLASLALLACGGSDDESTPAATSDGGAASTAAATEASSGGGDGSDVCALLTIEDLEAATGVKWGEGVFNEALSSDQQHICDWTATEGGLATAQVLVVDSDVFGSNRGSAEEVFGLADAPSISGPDDVYATEEGSIVGMKFGDEFVQVAYLPSSPENVLDATTQLAQAVANRK